MLSLLDVLGGMMTVRTVMRYLTCALIVSVWVEAAAAQESPAYVAAGVSFPHQAVLQAGSPPPFAAPGGDTVGWLVGGGVYLTSHLSLEVETSRTGVMRASREGRHNTSQVSTRRDWFLSFGLKTHLGRLSNLRVEPIAGMVLVGDEGTFSSFSGESRGYFPLDWVPGIMFGVDFRIGGRHLAFTPGLRWAFTGVPTGEVCDFGYSGTPLCREGAERWQYHHPRWTQRPSVGVRVNF
jgi:hypothetical protein